MQSSFFCWPSKAITEFISLVSVCAREISYATEFHAKLVSGSVWRWCQLCKCSCFYSTLDVANDFEAFSFSFAEIFIKTALKLIISHFAVKEIKFWNVFSRSEYIRSFVPWTQFSLDFLCFSVHFAKFIQITSGHRLCRHNLHHHKTDKTNLNDHLRSLNCDYL